MPTMEQIQPYTPIIIMALNGLIAGWMAGLLLGGGGLIRNLVVGLIGAFVGGSLVRFGWLKLPESVTRVYQQGALRRADPDFDHWRADRGYRGAGARRALSSYSANSGCIATPCR